MLLKNIVIGALMAIPALASANSLTETRERMAIEQQALSPILSAKSGTSWTLMFQEYNTGFRQPAAELINWLSEEGSIIFFSRCFPTMVFLAWQKSGLKQTPNPRVQGCCKQWF